MSKIYYKASEFYGDIKTLREEGVHRGVNVGFFTLDDYYNKKLGRCTYIYSAPFSGKSQFAFELAINSASQYDYITAVYSPESGTKEEIVAKLVFMITGKQLYSKHQNAIDSDLLKTAMSFIEEHFIFIDPDSAHADDLYENAMLTLLDFYRCVKQAETFYGITIQETLIDPFNELSHDFSKDEGRQDLYIERMLGIARRDAKINLRHNTIVTHVVDQQIERKGDIRYYPPAMPRELAGGQAWYRKGDMMISAWRPPFGLKDADGRDWEENEMDLLIQKVKPEYCGKRGTVPLFFDADTGRYYEKINCKNYYAFQYQKHLDALEKQHKLSII